MTSVSDDLNYLLLTTVDSSKYHFDSRFHYYFANIDLGLLLCSTIE